MGNFYAASTKSYENQCAETYMLYMMISSYFSKVRCINVNTEKHLHLYYRELSMNRQVSEEERILRRFESHFHEYLDQLKTLQCNAYIKKVHSNYIIYFYTGFDEVRITVYPNSQYKTELYPYHRPARSNKGGRKENQRSDKWKERKSL